MVHTADIMDINDRVKNVVEKEEACKAANAELREKYRRVLRRTVLGFDAPGKQQVVYENEMMLDKVVDELDSNVKVLDTLGKELQKRVDRTEEKMRKCEVDKVQKRVEVLNQQIRILEATMRYVNEGK